MAKGRSPATSSRINHQSPRARLNSIPARQLHVELEQTFAQLQLYESERQKVHAFNRRSVQDEIDARELAQAIAHKTEIEDAITRHEAVRQQAVAVLEAHMREEEEKRRREEEEERRQKEEEARRKAEEQVRVKEEQERRAKEKREKAEAAKRAAAQRAKLEEEDKMRKEREATIEKEKQERAKIEAEASKQREDAAKEAKAAAKRVESVAATSSKEPAWSSKPEIRHRHYLNIHKSLKKFRREFWDKAKNDPQLKPVVGEMRRAMRVAVGQLTLDDRNTNSKATRKVKENLLKAINQISSPQVVVNDYLPPHLGLLDKNTTTVPSLVIYLLSAFSKAVVNAFVGECTVNIKSAEPLGTMVAQIFSMPELQFKRYVPSPNSGIHYSAFGGNVPTPPMTPDSVSLISILMSKFHATAPILFGISGSEKTSAGKLRLGWRTEFAQDGDAQKSFVLEQKQYDRLVGLGAGYASVALRNFSKSSLTNPWPPYHFWESLSFIVNTKPTEVQPGHLLLLKSMLENSVDRFVQFFGDEGVAALRKATVDFPKSLTHEMQQGSAVKALVLLVETWKKEKNFHLE